MAHMTVDLITKISEPDSFMEFISNYSFHSELSHIYLAFFSSDYSCVILSSIIHQHHISFCSIGNNHSLSRRIILQSRRFDLLRGKILEVALLTAEKL